MSTHTDMLKAVVEDLGGAGNIKGVTHCATRLRFSLVNPAKADMEAIGKLDGVLGTQVASGTNQVLIGTHVGEVYDELVAMPGITGQGEAEDDIADAAQGAEKIGLIDRFTRMMSAVYAPYLPVLATGGIASGIAGLLANLGVITSDSLTYQVLYAIFYGLINFFPITLAYTAAKHFRCNQYVAAALGAAIMYPGVADLLVTGETATLFGVGFTAYNFTGSFIPILCAVFCMSHFEHWLKKVVPAKVQFTVVPLCCLVVFVPVTVMVFGPLSALVANAISAVYNALVAFPILTSIVFGGFFSLVILLGMHWAVLPIELAVLAEQGSEITLAAGGMGNYAILGVTLAALVLTKKAETKQTAGAAAFTLGLCGISEPCLYGVVLKDKRLIASMILAGMAGGLVCGLGGVMCTNFAYAGILSFGAWLGAVNFPMYCVAIAVSLAVGFGLTTAFYKLGGEKELA